MKRFPHLPSAWLSRAKRFQPDPLLPPTPATELMKRFGRRPRPALGSTHPKPKRFGLTPATTAQPLAVSGEALPLGGLSKSFNFPFG